MGAGHDGGRVALILYRVLHLSRRYIDDQLA